MLEPAPHAELMRSLGRLVRGLSALFWGLPLTLLVSVKTGVSEWLKPMGMLPPLISMGILLYGLILLSSFQKQERIWIRAIDRAKLLAVINIGLAPFIFWWNKLPFVPFYSATIGILILSGVLFLFDLNQVLQRLAAMLPDETLRLETKWFTSVNLGMLIFLVSAAAVYVALDQIDHLPAVLVQALQTIEPGRVITLLILLPLALTMTLIWKIKEVIIRSVFNAQS
ncbi:MAG: hypothetical protein EXS31_01400 [Pedosphaera sp.]|nr:hypothetical protein [Pedosphaera sp.]